MIALAFACLAVAAACVCALVAQRRRRAELHHGRCAARAFAFAAWCVENEQPELADETYRLAEQHERLRDQARAMTTD